MENNRLPKKFCRRRHKIWHAAVSVFACMVVFVTTYMLILPAITMDRAAYYGMESHQHSAECYAQELVCGLPEGDGEHTHTEACYEDVLICADTAHEAGDAAPEDGNDTYAVSMPQPEEAAAAETATAPVSVDPYITGAALYYRADSLAEWIEVTEDLVIPANAELKLTVNFDGIPLTDLQNSGGLLLC